MCTSKSLEESKLRITPACVTWVSISMLVGVLIGHGVDLWWKRGRMIVEKPSTLIWNGTTLQIGPGEQIGLWPEIWPGYVVTPERHPDDRSGMSPMIELQSDELLIELQVANLYPRGKRKLENRIGQFMELSCHMALTEKIGSPDDAVHFLLQLSPLDRYRDSISYIGPARYKPEFFRFASVGLQALGLDVSARELIDLCSVQQKPGVQ